jgi:hypothetical protein
MKAYASLLLIVFVLSACGRASHANLALARAYAESVAAPQPEAITLENTTTVVGITLDGKMRAFLFISDHGKPLPMKAADCSRDAHCMQLVEALKDKRGEFDLYSQCDEPEGESVPDKKPDQTL